MKQIKAKATNANPASLFYIQYDGKWSTLVKKCQKEMSKRNIESIEICDETYYYTIKKIEHVKKEEFIRTRDTPTAPVYIRGEYTRIEHPRGKGRYCCTKYDDINAHRYLKKGTLVAVYFDF